MALRTLLPETAAAASLRETVPGTAWFQGPLRVAGCLAMAASLSILLDLPVCGLVQHPNWPSDLHKVLDLSEAFAHGYGVLAIVLATFVLCPPQRRQLLTVLGCAFGAGLAADAVKLLVLRLRPNQFNFQGPISESFLAAFTWVPPAGYDRFLDHRLHSFPSGHAATAFGLAWGLSYAFPRGRWYFFGLASLAAAERVFTLQHYLSDVVAGAALAAGVAAVATSRGLQRHEVRGE